MIAMFLALAIQSQEVPGYSKGPFNLVLRWGDTSPVVIRYENKDRCELAALAAATEGDALGHTLDEKGRPEKTDKHVRGPESPWAFCIPG